MKKIKKLILLCTFCMVSIGASAADIPNNEIWYTSSNGKVVTPYKSDVFGASIVSNTYSNGKGIIKFNGNVSEIGSCAFEYCSGLTSVTIGNSVTSIGSSAFYGCSGLTSVTIPNSVTEIGNGAFSGCSGLTSVTIPNSVTDIGNSAFYGCSGLTSVTIPNSVTSIGDFAFEYCSGLSSVTIPNSVTDIGSYAFYGCSGLTSVTIGNSVTSIGYATFYGCTSLPVIDNVRYADTYLIEAVDKNLSTSKIKDGTKWIGSYAFEYCSGLSSVTIPNSVTSIGSSAFSGCSGLSSVTIPNSVTDIASTAFYHCYFQADKFVNNSSLDAESNDYWGATIYEKKTADGLCIKGNCVVKYYGNAQSVTIPNYITSIGDDAFSGCSGLTSVTISNSVTSIGEHAFSGCSGLTSVTIPNSVTSIGNYAFIECSGLTSVTIGNSVTSIGYATFYGCTSLPVIDNVRYADTYLIEAVDKNLSTYKIKEGTKWIGSQAFYNCSGLSSVTIPNSVTSIGDYAFYYCSGLSSVTIPNSVTSIGYYAFYGCSGLTSVTIPNSVTEIGNAAFSGCSGLASIKVSSGNTVYDSRNDCNAIIDTKSNTLVCGCKNTIIPNSVTSIGSSAFDGCKGLTSVTIPNSVTSIGSYAFYGCSGLTSVTIPNSVTSIGERAFYNCSGLTSVTIPNSVTEIGSYAFSDNESLYNIEVHWIEPIVINENTFSNYNATLKVPMVSLSKYQSAEVWKKFKNIKGINTSVVKCIDCTQTTVSLMITDDNIDVYEEIGVRYDNKYYKANADGIITIRNLYPDETLWSLYTYAKYGGEYYISNLGINVSTKPLNPEIAVSDVMANKTFVRGVYDIGDAHIYKTTFNVYSKYDNYEIKEQEYKNDKFALTGLAPNTEYMITYYVYYHYGEGDKKSSYTSITKNLTTAQLKMKTLNPKNVSSTSSVVAAEANISDDETGVGFEWRKYDAPESLPSSRGSAIVYDGRMEGKINNLQPVYYNVRPYYESASGKMFYGDWITFDPTDFSYFEPTVHTYDFIDNPTTNSVEVRGYVMQGTDAVTEQGFEYWKTGKASKSKAAGNDVMRIQASGQMMIATLKDLDFESNYIVRAYVTTASGTIYGEERSFTTPKATPEKTLGDANMDGSINVNDITTIAKFILEGKVSPWSEVNADANEDGTINVNDITKTAEIILLRAKAEMEAKAAMEAMQNKE